MGYDAASLVMDILVDFTHQTDGRIDKNKIIRQSINKIGNMKDWTNFQKLWMGFLWLLPCIFSIKFDYIASQHQFICFHEDVEKQTRYQLIVMANKPTFSLQIFEQENSIYEDDRPDIELKEYSAFAKVDGQLMFCLANKDFEQPITYGIEFYHGIHLNGFSNDLDSDSYTQLWDIMAETFEMQNFVKMAYNMNVKTLLERNEIISNVGVIITIATLIFFIVLVVTRSLLVSKLKKILRQKKLI